MNRIAIILLATLAAVAATGCGKDIYMTPDRLENGLVLILPGIEGESGFNHDIRLGLMTSGVYRGLQIHTWSRPVPLLGPLLTQVDFVGNWLAGGGVADMIVKYQDKYPGRPVYIIGHSGGGGVAVFAAAQMPPGRHVDGLILLHASMSCDYDLTSAIQHCKNGILNIFNKDDVGLLGIGTTFLGNVDGGRSGSAGRVSFDMPKKKDKEAKKEAYQRLYQLELTRQLIGGGDSHAAATKVPFVLDYVAQWIISPTWPPEGMEQLLYVPPPEPQPASQPETQPESQPASQPATQPADDDEEDDEDPSYQPTEQATSQPDNRPASKSDSQPTSQPAEEQPEHSDDQPESQPADKPKAADGELI